MSCNELSKVSLPYVFSVNGLHHFESFSRSPSPQESAQALEYFREIAKGARNFDFFAESSCLHPLTPARVKIANVCSFNATESRDYMGAYQAVFSHDDSSTALFCFDREKHNFTRINLCIKSRSIGEDGASFENLVFVTNSIWRKHSDSLFVSENGRMTVHVSSITNDDLIDLLLPVIHGDLTTGDTFSKQFFEDFVTLSFPDVYRTIFKIQKICYRSWVQNSKAPQ
jgi:hypothetical protein